MNTAFEIASVDFAKGDGLVPAIVQDADSGAVLMMAYMNREALEQTVARRRAVFFSRSKQRLWEKGETTGHTLDVVGLALDCDQDTLLVTARPHGPACPQRHPHLLWRRAAQRGHAHCVPREARKRDRATCD
jgi:phosphoribosyl-ATP pyrophosphohydrolase/phosphoribosyl-AMP cyclohydrolase